MNSSWHLYRKCFVVSLNFYDFILVAHEQKRQSERSRVLYEIGILRHNNKSYVHDEHSEDRRSASSVKVRIKCIIAASNKGE